MELFVYTHTVRCTVIESLSLLALSTSFHTHLFLPLSASPSLLPPLLLSPPSLLPSPSLLPPPLPFSPSLPLSLPLPPPSRPPQAGHAGYCMTHTIPTLRRNKKQEELLMTSVSWLTPPSNAHHSNQTELQTVSTPPLCPGINTCRPMSYQEEGTKVSNYVTPQILIHEKNMCLVHYLEEFRNKTEEVVHKY